MLHGKKVVVVLPAYRAEKTLERTVREIPTRRRGRDRAGGRCELR